MIRTKAIVRAEIESLNRDARLARKTFDLVGLNTISAKLSLLEREYFLIEETVQVSELASGMSKEDRIKFVLNTNAIAILADMMYGYIKDSNEIISKCDPSAGIDQFNSFLDAGTKAKEAYRFFLENGSQDMRDDINNVSDEIITSFHSILKNKVINIIMSRK